MTTAVEVEQKLRALVPQEVHAAVPQLAALVTAAANGQLTQAALREQVFEHALTLRPLLQALAGQRLQLADSEIVFDPVASSEEAGDAPLNQSVVSGNQVVIGNIDVGNIDAIGSAIAIGTGATALVVSLTVHGAKLDPVTPQPMRLVPRPPTRPQLLDRVEPLQQLDAELAPRRVFWLAGQLGSGATTLAAAAANLPSASTFPDGVAYIDGATLPQNYADVVQAIYNRFFRDQTGVVLKPISEAPAQEQGDWLAAQLGELQALFVLDRLPLDVRELAQLADQLQGSGAVVIAPDGSPPRRSAQLALGPLPTPDALALLQQFTDGTHDQEQVVQLCERLSCLPLGLVLIGGLLAEGRSLTTLLERATALPAERQPLMHAVMLTLEALEPHEAVVLGALVYAAVTRAPFDMLVAVSERDPRVVGDALERMVALGLVVDVGRDTYDVAGAGLRRVLVRLLPENGEQRRGVGYWAAAVALPVPYAGWLDEQLPNLQAAARTALDHGLHAEARTLLRAIEPSLVAQGYWASWGGIIAQALVVAEATGDAALRAWALHAQGTRAGLLGDMVLAQQSLTAAEQVRGELGDQIGAALTRHNRSILRLLPPPLEPVRLPAGPGVEILIRRRSPFASLSFWLLGLLGVLVGLALVLFNFSGINAADVAPTTDAGAIALVPTATIPPTPTAPPSATTTSTPRVTATATLLATTTIDPTEALVVASVEPLLATPTETPTEAVTETPTALLTETPTAGQAPVPTETPTPTLVATNTATPVPTNTATPRPTNTPTLQPTATTILTSTETAISTATLVPTPTATATPTLPAAPAEGPTEEIVEVPPPSFTPTTTPTDVELPEVPFTPTTTPTLTPTATLTPTLMPSPTFIVVPPPPQ